MVCWKRCVEVWSACTRLERLLAQHSHPARRVFVKMDIEGAEFYVLPRLLQAGLLCAQRITCMRLEWHSWVHAHYPDSGYMALETFGQRLREQQCEPTRVIFADDESFLHDGKALPGARGKRHT